MIRNDIIWPSLENDRIYHSATLPWMEAGIEPTTFQAPPYVCYGKARALPTELPPPPLEVDIGGQLQNDLIPLGTVVRESRMLAGRARTGGQAAHASL
jgi:hypothetical protein